MTERGLTAAHKGCVLAMSLTVCTPHKYGVALNEILYHVVVYHANPLCAFQGLPG
jgi:hypothetical protein